MTDILETARWVAEGRLAPWAVSDESVCEMARKLLEAFEAVMANATAADELAAARAADYAQTKEREAQIVRVARLTWESELAACIEKAVEAEREACARVADAEEAVWRKLENSDVLPGDKWQHRQQAKTAWDIAKAIRARGDK